MHTNSNGKGDGMTDDNDHAELNGKSEAGCGENTEIKEENGKFGDVLNESIEDLGNVVELTCQ